MKLLLIDDHALFREGLSLLIASRLFPGEQAALVLEAASLTEAEPLLAEHADVDLALLTWAWRPTRAGHLAGLARVGPDVPVVVLSADDRPEVILAAIDGGGRLHSQDRAIQKVMRSALEHVLAGGVYLPDLPAGGRESDRRLGLFRSAGRCVALAGGRQTEQRKSVAAWRCPSPP